MACEKHSWWFDTPCPQCAATAAVTKTAAEAAPVVDECLSGAETPEIVRDPLLEDPGGDYGPLPKFLLRNPDNTFVHPEPWGELKPLKQIHQDTRKEDIRALSDAELQARLYSEMPVVQRQPFLQEATRRENRRKAHERLDRAGFLKSKDMDPEPE